MKHFFENVGNGCWKCRFCGQIEGRETQVCPKAPPASAPAAAPAQFPVEAAESDTNDELNCATSLRERLRAAWGSQGDVGS